MVFINPHHIKDLRHKLHGIGIEVSVIVVQSNTASFLMNKLIDRIVPASGHHIFLLPDQRDPQTGSDCYAVLVNWSSILNATGIFRFLVTISIIIYIYSEQTCLFVILNYTHGQLHKCRRTYHNYYVKFIQNYVVTKTIAIL